jgi:glycosyltransferase involved in cell wall biosynthesis
MVEDITILICSYNGRDRLSPTLKSLAHQNVSTIPLVTLMLVDNASTDDTANFTLKTWKELGSPYSLKVLTEEIPGKIHAQNKGLEMVETSYVLICDDDNELQHDYILRGYELLKSNAKIGALGGQGIVKSTVSIPSWFKEVAYMYACAPQGIGTGEVQPQRNVIYGAGMFLNMIAYRKAKDVGFKNLLQSRIGKSVVTGAEDGEICWWLRFCGYEIWYDENLKFFHHILPERLTDRYKERLTNMFKLGTPVGRLYIRIYRNQITQPVKFFWLKESIYMFWYLFNIPFTSSKNKKIELKRSLSQIRYFLSERKRYDEKVNYLLSMKSKLKLNT